MKEITSEDRTELGALTKPQVELLRSIISSPTGTIRSGASGYNGPVLGRAGSSLSQRGIIAPFGTYERQRIWGLTEQWLEKEKEYGKETLLNLLSKIGESIGEANEVKNKS